MIWKIRNQKYKYYLTRHQYNIQNKPDYKKYHDKNKDKYMNTIKNITKIIKISQHKNKKYIICIGS